MIYIINKNDGSHKKDEIHLIFLTHKINEYI